MKIGIVSNSATLYMPLLSALYNYKAKAGLMLYVGGSTAPDNSVPETVNYCNAGGIGLTFEHDKADLYAWLHQHDIVFFSGYSSIVKTQYLKQIPHGAYNIHFGALPQFRGPSPVFWQLRNGGQQIGLAIHVLTDQLDSGPIIWQQNISNQPHYNYDTVHQLLSQLQIQGVLAIVNGVNSGTRLPLTEQDESLAVYYPRPELKDVFINWQKMEAAEIIDTIQACNPWNMGAVSLINGQELKILDASIGLANNHSYPSGTIIINKRTFAVMCKGARLLNINFFKMGNNYVPARFAGAYGFKSGQSFASSVPHLTHTTAETN
ncbi:methionyl-tRNA formyltransferase [Mucilaginibacter lappiensis]|uniref:Methionyl-tRNA formyltransferase n=1 Tax=Mucilaginibacter lappiensis TaxID=354630 RepID=A0ABR6PCZ0_9SPHI|nr:formyltransferase family protein [Mucilaginibacter lappiensis]MBB6107618.1 methionyl-tRNA formyltransferase [Mucilaginibacter lappiensis]SIQ02689.1 methionyl-tRNA formyltransferase [Mucilaginibacter lappiensis]